MALLAQTGALNAARDEAFSWAAKARAALGALPDHPLRQTLSDLTHYVVSRVS
jgi:octaprenyl-diphosphate synthase